MTIQITRRQWPDSYATYYVAVRDGHEYYLTDYDGVGVGVQQRYIRRNGTPWQRRLPHGKVRDELLAALAQHKAAKEQA